jgi:hypothetical protein
MGTAASVEKKDGLYSFSLVERLCRENYFRNNGDAYKTALEDSIRNNTLDVLEVLIAAENATKMYPLHMSTLYGVLEPLELLVSAGFKCSLKNREELTALHCAATSSTTGSALCAMFIGLRDPNSLHIRDAKGSLPIHIAVERNNFQVMKALIEAGTKLNSTNAKGLDVRALAKQLNRNDMLEYIAETESSKKRGKKRGQAATAEPVNMERVMKVWEKFFENAMARNGLLLKASVTLPSVPAVPELQSTKIVVRPMKDTDVPNLVAASDGSALFGESSYDPLRIWRWLPDANIAAELHGGQHPSDSEEIFAKVFPSCPQTGADFIHLAIVDRIVKKPIGMLSVVDNNVKNLSARIGWYSLRCFA